MATVLLSLVPLAGTMTGAVIGIVGLELGALGNIAGKAIGLAAASLPIYLVLIVKIRPKLDPKLFKELIMYGAPLVLYGILGTSSQQMDKLIVGNKFDQADLGIFQVASTIVLPIGILLVSVWKAASPNMYRKLHVLDRHVVDNSYERKAAIRHMRFHYDGMLLFSALLVLGVIGVWRSQRCGFWRAKNTTRPCTLYQFWRWLFLGAAPT